MAEQKEEKTEKGSGYMICFQEVFDYVVSETFKSDFGDAIEDVKIVHGIPTHFEGEEIGKRYVDAWVEFDLYGEPYCFDPVTDMMVAKTANYSLCKIGYVATYDIDQAVQESLLNESFGPWDQKIVEEMLKNES